MLEEKDRNVMRLRVSIRAKEKEREGRKEGRKKGRKGECKKSALWRSRNFKIDKEKKKKKRRRKKDSDDGERDFYPPFIPSTRVWHGTVGEGRYIGDGLPVEKKKKRTRL